MSARQAAKWSARQRLAPVIGDDCWMDFLTWDQGAEKTEEEQELIRDRLDVRQASRLVCWMVTTAAGQLAMRRLVSYPKQWAMGFGDAAPWMEEK